MEFGPVQDEFMIVNIEFSENGEYIVDYDQETVTGTWKQDVDQYISDIIDGIGKLEVTLVKKN